MSDPHRTTPAAGRPAAFLDRDGVINLDHGYVGRWEDFAFVPGAVDAMRRLHQAGYALVVVTNQSGLARGYYSQADFDRLTEHMCEALAEAGAPLAAVYHCPHHPDGTVPGLDRACDCRKPAPGMLLRAIAELGLDPARSLMFGDKPSDLEAARAAGVTHGVLLATDARAEPGLVPRPDHLGLADAVAALLPES